MSMKPEYIESMWERALLTLDAAKKSISFSPDTAANRAYYAAFFAVSALFASEDKFLRSIQHFGLLFTRNWFTLAAGIRG